MAYTAADIEKMVGAKPQKKKQYTADDVNQMLGKTEKSYTAADIEQIVKTNKQGTGAQVSGASAQTAKKLYTAADVESMVGKQQNHFGVSNKKLYPDNQSIENPQPSQKSAEIKAVNDWREQNQDLFQTWRKHKTATGYNARGRDEAIVDDSGWNQLTDAQKMAAEEWGKRYEALGLSSAGYRLGKTVEGIGRKTAASVPLVFETAGQMSDDNAVNQSNKKYTDAKAALDQVEEAIQLRTQALGDAVQYDYDGIAIDAELEALYAKQKALQATVAQEKVSNPVSKESKAYKAFDKGQQRLEEAQTGLSNGEKFAYGVGTSVAQNAAMLPMEAVVPGSGLAMMGALSAADTVREETEKGTGASKAMGRALASGLIEAGTEKIGLDTLTDVVKGSSKSAVKNVIKNGLEKAAGAAGGEAVANMLSEMTAEGLEEVVGYMANYAVDKVSKEPDAEFSWSELLQNFAAGALAGGILGAGGTAVNTLQNKKQQNAIELQNQNAMHNIPSLTSVKKQPSEVVQAQPVGISQAQGGIPMLDGIIEPAVRSEKQQNTMKKTRNEQTEIVEKLRENVASMIDMDFVTRLKGNEFQSGEKKLSQMVAEFFDSIGNKVARKGFGEIILNKRSIKDDMAHGIGRQKAITFAAVPDVISKGRQIDFQPNWKGRGYDTYVFAAPVKVGEETNYVAAVVVSSLETNRHYLHEVIDENGNIIYKRKDAENAIKTGSIDGNTISPGSVSASFETSIPQLQQNARVIQSKEKNTEIPMLDSMRVPPSVSISQLSGAKPQAAPARVRNIELEIADQARAEKMQAAAQPSPLELHQKMFQQPSQNVTVPKKGRGYSLESRNLDAIEKYRTKAEVQAEATEKAKNSKAAASRVLSDHPVEQGIATGQRAEDILAAENYVKKMQSKFASDANNLGATTHERSFARMLARGEISEADIPGTMRPEIVKGLAKIHAEMLEAQKDGIAAVKADITLWQQMKFRAMLDEVDSIADGKDLVMHKVEGSQLYMRTPERNMKKVFGESLGNKLIDYIFTPMHQNEASKIAVLNKMYDQARALDLNEVERKLVQLVGDSTAIGQNNEKVTLEKIKDKRITADDLPALMDIKESKFVLEHQHEANVEKVDRALKFYRETYDAMYQEINNFRVEHGMKPLGKITTKDGTKGVEEGYFPHFSEEDPLTKTLKEFGIAGVSGLPTSIAGETAWYKPNSRWVGNFQQRTGLRTTYDSDLGFQQYMNSVVDMLYHTDDIMKLRQFDAALRGQYNDATMKETIDSIRTKVQMRQNLDDADKAYIDKIIQGEYMTKEANEQYSSFAAWLTDYTNKLANKQLMMDRGIENVVKRIALNTSNKIESAFGRNSVVGNLSSALNNLVTVPKILATTNTQDAANALRGLLNKEFGKSGLSETSEFLTGKKGVTPLIETNTQRVSRMIMEHTFEPVEQAVSDFAYYTKYLESKRTGQSELEAQRTADLYAANMMARRTKGARPLIMESKNPLLKLVTMFQTEVSNDFYALVDDLPAAYKSMVQKEGKKVASKQLMTGAAKYIMYSAALNVLLESITGYAPAPDPIGWLIEFFKDLFGDENKIAAGMDAVGGIAENVGGSIPGVSAIAALAGLGNGRVPLPQYDLAKTGNAVKALGEDIPNKEGYIRENLIEGLGFPALTTFMPFGGNQIKKTIKGATTMARGGLYKQTKEGEELKAEVNNDITTLGGATNWLKALAFGQGAIKEVGDYYDGPRTGYSAKDTEKMKAAQVVGLDQAVTRQVITEFKGIDKLPKDNIIPSLDPQLQEYAKQNNLQIDSKSEAKRIALLMDDSLSDKQKTYLAGELIDVGDNTASAKRNYKSVDEYLFSGLTDIQKAKFDRTKGFTKGQYALAYEAVKGSSGKMNKIIDLMRKGGYTQEEAERLYNMMK